MADLPRFIFRGNAMPFGGRITKQGIAPSLITIPGPPAAALAVVGGLSRATGAGANPHPALSWGATLAEAKGELLPNGHYQTTVTSSITKVTAKNDPNVFEADVLRATLVSNHANLAQGSIKLTEIMFGSSNGGMRLNNERIDVEVHSDLNDAPTLNDFEDKYQSNRDFFSRHQIPGKSVKFGDPAPRSSDGYIFTSVVRSVKWKGKVFPGNTLKLTGFGTIYFGEVIMNENNRRFTTVRLLMGSAIGADCAYAEADPNGTWGN